MTDLTNRQLRLRRRPAGLPSPEDFELTEEAAPVPGEGQVLVRTLLLSIDPAMRGWVAEGPNYVQAVPVGGVMRSFGIAEVVQSRNTRFREHDIIFGLPGWQEWAVLDEPDILRHIDATAAPLSAWLGVLGINGLTAYVGMVDIGRPEPAETVLVSSAAGSVGSAAGQIARILGARVVGLTSTEEKRDLCLRVFGFDDCINYRDVPDLGRAIAEACPQGVDVYFDSVGGQMLDAALDNMNVAGRIPVCGTIGEPADIHAAGPRLGRRLLVKRLTMQGFLATDHVARMDEIAGTLATWIDDGRLRYLEEISSGLEAAPDVLRRVLDGQNEGKSIVRVAEFEPA
jgi:NADPH-dependent curcumin reductase CurA